MKTQHVFNSLNLDVGKNAFCGPWNHDSYKGDYLIEAGADLAVRMHRNVVGPCSIITASSRTRQSFRRSWEHIREDATDVTVLCFVKRGRLRLKHKTGEFFARAGDFFAAKSLEPFFVECGVGSESLYEAIHLIVPTHFLRQHLWCEVATGFCVPASRSSFKSAERMLTDLVENQGDVSESTAKLVVDAALASISDAIRWHESGKAPPPSFDEIRLSRVLRYIDLHIADSMLSVRSVAEGCKLSQRSVFALFQRQGTTFTETLWGKRLQMAAQWLSTSKSETLSIKEVAYRVGFKSTAHFARKFKLEFRTSPRAFRGSASQATRGKVGTLVVDGNVSRH